MKKILAGFMCVVLLCTSFAFPVMASNGSGSEIIMSQSSTKTARLIVNGMTTNKKVVENKELISKIAKEQNLPNAEKILSITYTIGYPENTDNRRQIPNSLSEKGSTIQSSSGMVKVIDDIEELGDGYYFTNKYKSSWYYGPCSVTETYTRSDSAAYDCSCTIGSKTLGSALGCSFDKTYTNSQSYTVACPSNKNKVNLKVFTNYQKKSFTVYWARGKNGRRGKKAGTGKSWKPCGLIFQQTTYKK